MSLVASMIGPYRIERELARGGMGVIYLALDTRLNRAAAIKALPDDVAADPDRLARFKQEAQVLASLSHPNIAAIYGLEESDGRRYLALEHIEGETLADRIARGPLPIDETVDICLQIAAGVEAAHEGGIIHRDLKPGNVMITPTGVARVLDFGLARGKAADSGQLSESSPTLTASPTTMPGVILGTARYLSPEQARGKPVDRRTDIWSFGCILYECLTGRRAFEGESVSETIAKILERDVDWSPLPEPTPQRIRELLRRCLEKDPRKRLRDIGEARLALEEVKEGKVDRAVFSATPRTRSRVAAAALLAFASAALGLAGWNIIGPGRETGRDGVAGGVKHLSIVIPPGMEMRRPDISPDGQTVVFWGQPRDSSRGQLPRPRIYRRQLESDRFEPIEGSEGAGLPCFTMDGRWIVFGVPLSERSTQYRYVRVPGQGAAPPVTICLADPSWVGGTPLYSGRFIMGRGGTEYLFVSMNGALSRPLPYSAAGFRGTFQVEQALPGDRGVLLTSTSYEGGVFQKGVAVLDLKSGSTKMLLTDGGSPRYSPTGHLLFTRRAALLAVRFDLTHLRVEGEPFAIFDGLRTDRPFDNAYFWLSREGTLLYAPGVAIGSRRRLITANAGGHVSDWSGEQLPIDSQSTLSPDGKCVAITILNANNIDEIWISERGDPNARVFVAVPGADCWGALWSPTGKELAYTRRAYDDQDGTYIKAVDGSGAPHRVCNLEWKESWTELTSWAPDGSALLANRFRGEGAYSDVMLIPLQGGGARERVPRPLLSGVASDGKFSPDGKWVAFTSGESGRSEVYVAPYLSTGAIGASIKISSGECTAPRWSRDGKRVYFIDGQNRMMSVVLGTRPSLSVGRPSPLWNLNQLRLVDRRALDILPDGRLLLAQKGEEEDQVTNYQVVLNFFDELRQRTRAARSR